MGNNTQLYLVANLKEDIPENVKRILRCLNESEGNSAYHWDHCKDGVWEDDVEKGGWINEVRQSESHSLFKTERWWMLDSNFDDEMYKPDTLKVRGHFKNYDQEITKFVNWIRPYLDHDEGDMIGITEYDDADWHDPIIL